MRNFLASCLIIITIFSTIPSNVNAAGCVPMFNPIDNVDWTTYIRSFKFLGVCTCSTPPRFGVKIRYAEPLGLIETTSKPFFFPSFNINLNYLSGLFDVGNNLASHGTTMQVHYLWYPVFWVLGLLTDVLCLQVDPTSIDIAYMSEVDATWKLDELNDYIQPEKLLYANPIAQSICVADCVASTFQNPLNTLYWCDGCEGAIFPDTGNDAERAGNDLAGRNLLDVRLIDKLHSSFLFWVTDPAEAIAGESIPSPLCSPVPYPRIVKSQYLLQPACPATRFALQIGTMPIAYEFFGKAPGFEDYVNLVWRYRTCCLM